MLSDKCTRAIRYGSEEEIVDATESSFRNNYDEVTYFDVHLSFLDYGCGECDSDRLKELIGVLKRRYDTGGLLAYYCAYSGSFSWKVATLLYAISDYDIEVSCAPLYTNKVKCLEILHRLHYGEV